MSLRGVVVEKFDVHRIYESGYSRGKQRGGRVNRGDVRLAEFHKFGKVLKTIAQITFQTRFVNVFHGNSYDLRKSRPIAQPNEIGYIYPVSIRMADSNLDVNILFRRFLRCFRKP